MGQEKQVSELNQLPRVISRARPRVMIMTTTGKIYGGDLKTFQDSKSRRSIIYKSKSKSRSRHERKRGLKIRRKVNDTKLAHPYPAKSRKDQPTMTMTMFTFKDSTSTLSSPIKGNPEKREVKALHGSLRKTYKPEKKER
jgi:hypothetical protein